MFFVLLIIILTTFFADVPLDLIKNKLAVLSSLVSEIEKETAAKETIPSYDFDFNEKDLPNLDQDDIESKFPIHNIQDLNDIENRIKTCPNSRATLVSI